MKLLLDINQNSLRADFTVTENTAQLTLDSETFTAEISEPQPGFFTVIISGKVYQCVLENNEVIVNGKRIPVTIQAGIKERAEDRHSAGFAGDAPIQHVKNVRQNHHQPGIEKMSEAV